MARALDAIEKNPKRWSSSPEAARLASHERSYGVTTSRSPIKSAVHEPRQEKELEKIKTGVAAGSLATLPISAGTSATQAALGAGEAITGIPMSVSGVAGAAGEKAADPSAWISAKKKAKQFLSADAKTPVKTAGGRISGGGHRFMEHNNIKISKQRLKEIIKKQLNDKLILE